MLLLRNIFGASLTALRTLADLLQFVCVSLDRALVCHMQVHLGMRKYT